MADIINLRTARKQKKRRDRQREAARNQALSAIPAKVRKAAETEAQKSARKLDGHRLEKPSLPDHE